MAKALGDLEDGLKKRGADGVDASMACKGGSVDSGATRKEAAPTPPSLGPRKTGM